jgi:hypothetical protein
VRPGLKIGTPLPATESPSFDIGAAQIVEGPVPRRLLLSDFQIR